MSHHCHGNRGQIPGGTGGGGGFGQVWAWVPDGSVGGDGGSWAQPGAHVAVGDGARAALRVRLLLILRSPATLQASPFQEVREHLTFAFHADLATTDKVVVVDNKSMDVLSHLKKKDVRLSFLV